MAVENKTVNIRKAVYDFLCAYTAPAIDPQNILWGNQNNVVLPKSEDYIIFSLATHQRHGSGFEHWSKTEDKVTLSETIEAGIQIDFYASSENGGDGMNAMLRAQSIETVARSYIAPAFFNKYGASCLYCDDARNNTSVGDSDTYEARWTVTLHLSYASIIEVSQDYFKAVGVNLVNVDSRFPPE